MLERHEYGQFRDVLRRLCEEKIKPYAAAVDREARFPVEAIEAFKEMQLVALPFAEKIGGQEADILAQVICLEEVARVCATSSLTLMVIWAGFMPIAEHGSEALIDESVRPALDGDLVSSICLTEPHGGSDLWGVRTRAERQNDGWVLNGQKCFITNATRADWFSVLARTGEKSYGVFAVHKDDPGISVGPAISKMGVKGSPTADVFFDQCWIPVGRCLGEPDQGYQYITDALTYTRPLIAAQALGIAQGALDAALAYVKERELFGQPLARFQMTKGTIGELATLIEAGRQLLYRASEAVQNRESNARTLASMAKLYCSDVAMRVTTEAVQLHGGAGYVTDYPVERMMRDAKITQIYEGTSEIQKLIISSALLSD